MPHRRSHRPVVLTCSGASDVGELCDRLGRSLGQDQAARLECTAAVAARMPDTLDGLRRSKVVLAIDGCASHCVSKILDRAGIENCRHLELGELGFAKGHSPATETNVRRAAEVVRVLLG